MTDDDTINVSAWPILVLVLTAGLSAWGLASLVLTAIWPQDWLIYDAMYIICLVLLLIVTLASFLAFRKKSQGQPDQKRDYLYSAIALVYVLGNIEILAFYLLFTYAASVI